MLPMPPRTAAVNAAIPGRNPMKKLTDSNVSANSTPAIPGEQSADRERDRDHDAVDVDAHEARDLLSSATARIDFPVLRPRDEDCRTTIATIEITTTTTCDPATSSPRIVHDPGEDLGLRRSRGLRSEEPSRGVLQEQRRADRGDQRDQSRRVTERPIRDPLEQHGDHHDVKIAR